LPMETDKATKARKVRRIRDAIETELYLRRVGRLADTELADRLLDELAELSRQGPPLTLADVYARN